MVLNIKKPTGPQVEKIIEAAGLFRPKVHRNRATGIYCAEWLQRGLVKSVPPASFFVERLQSRFEGIRIINTQEVQATWREGHPNIISTVFIEIIGEMKPKETLPVTELITDESPSTNSGRAGVGLDVSKQESPSPVEEPGVGFDTIIPNLLESIQRPALQAPAQPIALLPARTPVRHMSEVCQLHTNLILPGTLLALAHICANPTPRLGTSLRLTSGTLPTETGGNGSILPAETVGADGNPPNGTKNPPSLPAQRSGERPGERSPLSMIRKYGAAGYLQRMKTEAHANAAQAVAHYRAINPPVTIQTLEEMELEANTITVDEYVISSVPEDEADE